LNKLFKHNKIKQLNNKQKGILFIIIFFAVELIIFLPFVYDKIQYRKINFDDIKSIEYVKYEGELFQSIILSRRYTENDMLIYEFQQALNGGIIKPYYNFEECNEVLIITTYSNENIYIYLNSDILGLNYGNVFLQVSNINDIISKFPIKELVIKQN
jgi:hypothetical protein